MGHSRKGVYRFIKRFTVFVVFIGLICCHGEPQCSCAEDCEPYQDCPENEDNCNKVNVAYGRKAMISSRYGSSNKQSGPACVAVNGRTSSTFQYLNTTGEKVNCIHTAGGDEQWWTVHLGQNYTIASITIFKRSPNVRLKSTNIHVDNQLCYQFTSDEGNEPLSLIINCESPLRGQVVNISKDRSASGDDKFLNFCEVQIWVCKPRIYGVNCDKDCGHCRNNGICDNYNGTCYSGCADYYYGQQCHTNCGCCKNRDTCDFVTGKCQNGCQTGYQTPFCNTTCSNEMYGEDCSQKCGHCASQSACDPFNGTCLSGCDTNFAPPLCKVCIAGFYGERCHIPCGHCKGKVCNYTGDCVNGCESGYGPPKCDTTCTNKTFGEDCASACGHCKGGDTCNIYNGSCSACEDTYLLPLCLRKEGLPETSQGPIIGGAIAAVVVVLALLAVVGFLVYRKRREKKQAGATRSSEHLTANLSGNMQAFAMSDKKMAAARPKRTAEEHVYINTIVPNLSEGSLQGSDVGETGEEEDEGHLLDESSDNVYSNVDDVYSTFQATHPSLDAVQTYLVGRLASGELQQEFKDIPKLVKGEPQEVAQLEINMKKNRFRQVLPYDKYRVVLEDGYTKGQSNDFINASYIKGYGSDRMYIAAQGPKQGTVRDFWRMIWQERITHIVMLANLTEDGKDKCSQYWPERKSGTATYGPVKVTASEVNFKNNFYVRTFRIQASGSTCSREVTQYHYISWPDHGVPTTTSLIRFWRYVTSRSRDSPAPLLVHCSAGVGRTGSFIGLDIGKEMAARERHINVPDLVTRLRQERTLMVQSVEQYVFLHEALLEAYTARDTAIFLENFDSIFPHQLSATTPNQRIDNEFKSIVQMQTLTSTTRHDIATQEENKEKNRSLDVLPSDNHIVYLTECVKGRNQYINAVFMPTFHDPHGSILTQLPLPSTLVDFWRLVVGNDITTIVSLCSPNEEKEVTSFCQYWPKNKDSHIQSGPYTISLQSKKLLCPGLTSCTLSVDKKDVESTQTVRLLHFEGWEGEAGCDMSSMIHLLDLLFTSSLQDGTVPKLLIQCRDGVGKSGLFSALVDIVTRITDDREVDIYMTIRHLHNIVPKAVMTLAQYRYCYVIAQAKSRSMSIYANA